MARNGPFGPAGARPPARRHPADDPFALPPQGQNHQYAEPPPPPPPPAQGHGQRQGQGFHFPPEPEPNFGFNGQQPPSLDQYQPGAPQDIYGQPQWGQHDPSAYDLGSYMPNAQQAYPPNGGQGYPPNGAQGYPQSGGQGYPPGSGQAYAPNGTQPYPQNGGQPYPPAAAPQPYAPNGAPAYPHASDAFAEGGDPYTSMDPPPFHRAGGQQHQPYAPEGYAEPEGEYGAEGEYEQEYEEEDAESGRGRRWMFIVAALVGAIGVGGALAFTYKSFVAPTGGRVPLVKAEPNLKVRPDNGALPSSDRRLQGRLGEETPQRAASAVAEPQEDAAGADEQGGPRRVRTIPITPGGGPGIQVSQPPPVQASSQPMVPGIMLDNMAPRPQPTPAAAPPQRVTIGQPPPQRQSPPEAEEAPPSPPARRATPQREAAPPPPVVVKNAPATRADPPPTTTAAPPPATSSAGYVAVLSSQKTRMDALKAFADLQQKYGEALSGRVPDVQEANLGAKGIWYRVVVGPPGSRSAASDVCGQLKSAGYGHCWVNAY